MTPRDPLADPAPPHRVVVVGLMGVGKTRTGAALADRLGWRLWDSDAALEAMTGGTGADLAARAGVAELHHLEADLLLDVLDPDDHDVGPAVVCAAASVVDSHRCRAALRDTTLVVWLEAPVDVLLDRRVGGTHRRAAGRDDAATSPHRRHDRFAEVADLRLDARRPTDELVADVVDALRRRGVVPVSR